MPNYLNSKIYKLVCNKTGLTYYGSTTRTLSQRLTEHKSRFKQNILHCKSIEIIKNGDYSIVLCEECPCENKDQLKAIERKWIETNDCVNKLFPSRTNKEYYETNKKEINSKKKERYENQKEKIKCDYQTKKEEFREKNKEYYYKNRETILRQKREKYFALHNITNE